MTFISISCMRGRHLMGFDAEITLIARLSGGMKMGFRDNDGKFLSGGKGGKFIKKYV